MESEQKTSIVTSNVTQKKIRTSMEIMVLLWSIKNIIRQFGKEKPQKVFENINVLACEEFIIQQKPLIFDFKIRKINNTRRKFAFMKKTWKWHEDCGNSNFLSHINKYKESSQHISKYTLRVVKEILPLKDIGMFWMELCWMLQLQFVDEQKAQARYRETWWWNNNVRKC